LDAAVLRTDIMRGACEKEYLGGFSLANWLTLHAEPGIPWRKAQVIAGEYIVADRERNAPIEERAALLRSIASRHGYHLLSVEFVLREVSDVRSELWRKQSAGSTHPTQVTELLDAQQATSDRLTRLWAARRAVVQDASANLDGSVADARNGPTDAG
jgi:argininosuccinate lyase